MKLFTWLNQEMFNALDDLPEVQTKPLINKFSKFKSSVDFRTYKNAKLYITKEYANTITSEVDWETVVNEITEILNHYEKEFYKMKGEQALQTLEKQYDNLKKLIENQVEVSKEKPQSKVKLAYAIKDLKQFVKSIKLPDYENLNLETDLKAKIVTITNILSYYKVFYRDGN